MMSIFQELASSFRMSKRSECSKIFIACLSILSFAIIDPSTVAAMDGPAENASLEALLDEMQNVSKIQMGVGGSDNPAGIAEIISDMANNAASPLCQVEIIITNDDDSKVDLIFLSIDSNDTDFRNREIGPGSTASTVQNLTQGDHWFYLSWRDISPDPNKRYYLSQKKRITRQNIPLDLIIPRHPNSTLRVQIKNDTGRETDAFLYVDEKFKQSLRLNPPDVMSGGWTEFADVPVDEGIHEVSLRWLWTQDPGIHMEYQKTKKVSVEGNSEAVYFIATKGLETAEKATAKETIELANETAEKSIETRGNTTSQVMPLHQNSTSESSSTFGALELEVSPTDPSTSGTFYIYLFMLMIAIYLAFRR